LSARVPAREDAVMSKPSRSSLIPVVLLVVLTFLTTLVAAACVSPAAQSAPPPAAAVTAAKAIGRDVTDWDEFTGRLEAVHHVDVRPRVSGLLAAVRFTEGAVVRQGDVLFEIDPRPFQAQVDRLRADLARARAALTRAAAERDRADRLSAEKAISTEEHDRRSSAAIEAKAQVSAVEAALRVAELDLEFTRVVAPITGRVGRAIVTEGNLVSSGPGEATLLTTLVSVDPIYASFEVDEQSFLDFQRAAGAARRKAGAAWGEIRMALVGDEDFPRTGRLQFLDNQLDAATGTIRVRAVFANADGALTPGLFVRLRLSEGKPYPAVLVRDEAVGTDLDKRFVYVVGADKAVAYRAVTLGPLVDGLRVVRNGVEPDEVVVVNGLQRVRPGVPVDATLRPMEPASQERAQ
jgi:multidrug efflux system membrane fusion protein